MDNVCNRCLFSIPSKVEMAEEQEYLRWDYKVATIDPHCLISNREGLGTSL